MFIETSATKKIKKLSKRIRAVPGGTSAGKTISILLILIAKAQNDKEPTITSVVSESIPHLKRGAIRDFKNILQTHSYWKDANWNATDLIYTFETGSKIEFFSSENGDKLRGARRHRLFVNEANNVSYEAFQQLEIRTSEFVFLDWNPTNEFWFYDFVEKREDTETLTTTYKDNEGLQENIVNAIERRKEDKNWWRVYGEGKLGEIDAQVYKGWKILDEIPPFARLVRRGLDFGYTNDPTAIVSIYKADGAYIVDEEAYATRLSNEDIAQIILNLEEQTLVVADSAEPKSIDVLKKLGVNIIPATKGPGSVSAGIANIQNKKIFITARSENLYREYKNYLFMEKNGKRINTPYDRDNHALDALRYAFSIDEIGQENDLDKALKDLNQQCFFETYNNVL